LKSVVETSSSDPPRTTQFDEDGVDFEQTLDDVTVDVLVAHCIATRHAPTPSYGELCVSQLVTNTSVPQET